MPCAYRGTLLRIQAIQVLQAYFRAAEKTREVSKRLQTSGTNEVQAAAPSQTTNLKEQLFAPLCNR